MPDDVGDDPQSSEDEAPDTAPSAALGGLVAPEPPRVELVPIPTSAGPLGAVAGQNDPYASSTRAVAAYLVAQLSPRSRQTASDALRRIVRLVTGGRSSDTAIVPWTTWGFEQLSAVRTGLFEMSRAGAISPGTANLTLSHLRGLIRTAYGMGLVPSTVHELTHRSTALKNIPGKRVARGRALSLAEERALRQAGRELAGYQPQLFDAIVALAIGTGARRDELAALPLVALEEPGAVTIIGKGNKERRVTYGDQVQETLDTWLSKRAELTPNHAAVFCGPTNPHTQLSKWSLWAMVRAVSHEAFGGETPCTKGCRCLKVVTGPHDFRRTFATRVLDQGVDIRQLQVLMGHESPETTGRYDKREHDELFARMRKMRILAE